MTDLVITVGVDSRFVAHLTSAVQLGFITGTLVFAILTIADRFSPVNVFVSSAVMASIFNLGLCLDGSTPFLLLVYRFGTGFFLAGIYPVGMKIASDHFKQGLGKSLGFLVGALVLGTALPHLIKFFQFGLHWKTVILYTSILCFTGGFLIKCLIKDGPYRKTLSEFQWKSFMSGFKNPKFKVVAFGYFGHMWELYAFWAFIPVILSFQTQHWGTQHSQYVSLWSFFIIGIGSVSCVIGGFLSTKYGEFRTAFAALLFSALCCLVSPVILHYPFHPAMLLFYLFWGSVVITDSPLFSSQVARYAVEETRGTSLTIVNCIGFAITILSIQLLQFLSDLVPNNILFLFLLPGPGFGLYYMWKRKALMV